VPALLPAERANAFADHRLRTAAVIRLVRHPKMAELPICTSVGVNGPKITVCPDCGSGLLLAVLIVAGCSGPFADTDPPGRASTAGRSPAQATPAPDAPARISPGSWPLCSRW
jgi:hypothetical protein